MCSDAPDTTKADANAAMATQLSKEQLDWAKQVYADTAPDRAATAKQASAVSDAQLKAMNTATDLATDYDNYNKTTYRPLEQKIVADATAYDTPERRAAAAAQAAGGVISANDAQRAAASREALAMGVDPSSGAYAGMATTNAAASAAQAAAAGNAASTQVETVGHAMQMDAASLGRNLPSAQATAAGTALTAGNSAVGSATAANNATMAGNGVVQTGYQTGINGLNQAAGVYNQAAQVGQSNDSGMWSGLGAAAGAAAMAF